MSNVKMFFNKSLYWDSSTNTMYYNSNSIKFTKSESMTLELLINNLDKSVSMNEIYEYIFWDDDRDFNPNTIRNIISKIRSKLKCNIVENIYGSAYIIRSSSLYDRYESVKSDDMLKIEPYLLDIIDQAQNGISITNPRLEDNPIVYCNMYFKEIFGYSDDEIIGKNPRFLRKNDEQEEVIDKIRDAMNQNLPLTIHINNYTKSNVLVPTELTISPIFDRFSGELMYYLGIQKVLIST